MVKVALFVRLEAKPGKETAVASFLESALPLANQEATTPVWFALRLGPSTFGIFDAFADEAGRSAHLAGPIAAALMANADELLAQPPQIDQVDVLAAKLPHSKLKPSARMKRGGVRAAFHPSYAGRMRVQTRPFRPGFLSHL